MNTAPRKTRKAVWVVLIAAAVICGGLVGAFLALTHDLPQIRRLEAFNPSSVTRIYSADRSLLAELFIERRDPVALEAIPKALKSALVITEDQHFYRHSGIDLKGILRAAWRDIRARAFVEGASTITQQLAKTLFLTPRKTLVRKLREALLAVQLERRYTKDEILELYLNQVYFGSGAYGVESAARIFFGKPVADLGLSECALVAAMPKAPSRYSPLVDPELARRRRNIVLRQMHLAGLIDRTAFETAREAPVRTAQRPPATLRAPYFIDTLKRELEETMGSALLYKGGLTVFTTLLADLQAAAEKAVADGLVALETRMRRGGQSDAYPQAALLALDVQTGGILALVGGRDYAISQYNRAVDARRQPGSAFKPIVYAQAIEHGFAQNRLLLDAPVVFKGALEGEDWRPENFSRSFQGEMTLRKALALSKNIPSIRLAAMLGPSAVARFGHSLGITAPLPANLSLALGTATVSLSEMTAAYAAFANRGLWIQPYGVTEIQDRHGRILWRAKPQKRQALSRSGAAIVTNLLEGVIAEGTGKKAQVLRPPLAGKTGTTDRYQDALFIGFSPGVAAGVWVGRDDNRSLGRLETGSRAALPIWIDFMRAAIASRPHGYFDIPDEVVKVYMEPESGRRLPPGSPGAVAALFRKGTEPR